MAVRERYLTDTCQQMGLFWPEFFDGLESDECALGVAKFDSMGAAIFKNKDSPAAIYKDPDNEEIHSILDRGVSVHGCKTPKDESGAEKPVEACCLIEPIGEEEFMDLKKMGRKEKKAIKQRRREEKKKAKGKK